MIATEDHSPSPSSELEKAALISELNTLPPYRKLSILIILCTALFLDTFNNSSLFTALPVLSLRINIPDNESVWLFGGYQLTFAALLLISGRVSDLYNPKWVFVFGSASLTVFTLVAGFIRKEIPIILLRALMGAGAALTIPSSQHLIVHLYPEPEAQAKALAVFGGMAGIGLVFGLLVGGLFVEFVSWPWAFYFGAILSGTISIGILLLVPNLKRTKVTETRAERLLRFKRLDLFGVSIITVALLLFIFAVTSGSSTGWGSAQVIAPLVLSVFLAAAFFVYEAYIPENLAALPPKVWKYENVGILVATNSIPFMWWGSIYPLFSWFWQVVDEWSPIKVAIHFLPVALGILPVIPVTAELQRKIPAKWIILSGFGLLIIANILLPFDNSPDRYWRFGFPGFLIGTIGAATIYSTLNIVILANTPPEISGVASALFIAAGQTGAGVGLAIVTSIQTSVEKHHGGPFKFNGRQAGLWFLLAISVVFAIVFAFFMTDSIGPVKPPVEKILESENKTQDSDGQP